MPNKENAKQQIKELIEKYNKVVEEKRVSKYNEEMTKKDFILPLFRALGWNVENSSEVTAEETISKKRVDYGFRINDIPKFFLEAKALKADLNDHRFIEQAIDYAWAKGCTWAVLTDFESVMIFNSEWKAENLLQNLLRSISYREFIDRFDELWLLSRESFEQGLIDKEAERLGKKAKLAPIDQQLLDDFSRWRNSLSKNILNYNKDKKLTEEELDETVQRFLNRLVFIRKAEDAELEGKVLLSTLREWEGDGAKALYIRLVELFRKFGEAYDSELFEEALVDEVVITNDVLKEVINGLYGTKDRLRRYDFAIIDADVLGAVYEQYLGHILKKTKKRVDVKESHARRKEEGIYYTPTYIVDYIVRNTLGELLKNRKVDVEKIRVLDSACGSGSFLIKAFDVLNEHYIKHDKDYQQTQLDITGQGTTFTRKVKILTDNIFGVDLDRQAVEIARLNLLLKIAEKKEELPKLKRNIKCGNSLIDDEKVAGDKAFRWEQEFKQILDEGRFDVVIGNPPYIRNTELPNKDKIYYNRKYASTYKQYDIFVLFFEIGIKLLKNGGYLGFITSNKFLASDYGQKLRDMILKNCKIVSLVDVSYLKIFKDASTYPVITILQKEANEIDRKNNEILFQKISEIKDLHSKVNVIKIKQSKFLESADNRLLEEVGGTKFQLVKKIDKDSIKLKELFTCQRGSPKNKIKILNEPVKNSRHCVVSRDVSKYVYKSSTSAFVVSDLQNRALPEEKILLPRTVLSLKAAYDKGGNFIMDRIYYLISKKDKNVAPKFVTSILNSKLIDFYYKVNFATTHVGGGYLDLRGTQIVELPVKIIPERQQRPFIELVDKMLSLNKRLNEIGDKKTDERAKIEEKIKKTDAEIDELIYKLYGITESERKIIEESLK